MFSSKRLIVLPEKVNLGIQSLGIDFCLKIIVAVIASVPYG